MKILGNKKNIPIQKKEPGFLKKMRSWFSEKMGPTILKWRKSSLIVFAVFGIIFAYLTYFYFFNYLSINKDSPPFQIVNYFVILSLGLPTFFLLWFFRTSDTRESINNTVFFESLKLLSGTIEQKRHGLAQLMYLRNRQKVFKEQIDLASRGIDLGLKANSSGIIARANLNSLNLQGVDLQEANLQGVDLRRTNLQRANLQRANLQGADLREASFQEASLKEANLQKANLRDSSLRATNLQMADFTGADLQRAILQKADLQGADFLGAKYNDNTKFPEAFGDPKKAGMIKIGK